MEHLAPGWRRNRRGSQHLVRWGIQSVDRVLCGDPVSAYQKDTLDDGVLGPSLGNTGRSQTGITLGFAPVWSDRDVRPRRSSSRRSRLNKL